MNNTKFNVAFEKTILSSLIFQPELIAKYAYSIKMEDFYLPAFQNIFKVIMELEADNKPIDEEFIKGRLLAAKVFDEVALLDVIMANPIANLSPYIEEIKKLSQFRALHNLGVHLINEEFDEVTEAINYAEVTTKRIIDINLSADEFNIGSLVDAPDGETEFILKEWLPLPRGTVSLVVAPGGCVDGETEFLTPSGWKKIENYQEGDFVLQVNKDTLRSSFTKPTAYIKELDKREAYVVDGGSRSKMNMVLTPEHRVLYESKARSGKSYRNVKTMQEIVENIYTKKAISSKNDRVFDGKILSNFIAPFRAGIRLTNEELKVMVAVLADGHFPKDRINNHCRINIKKSRKKIRLREILELADIKFIEKVKDSGYSVFEFFAPMKEKRYKRFWDCNKEQLEIICNEFPYWDGSFDSRSGNRKFHTTIKEDADFIQYALSSTTNSIVSLDTAERVREKSFTEYTVRETSSSGKLIAKSYLKRAHLKDDIKYCFTVDETFWVARRGNYIFLTGNTGKSWTALQMALRHSYRSNHKSVLWLSEDPIYESKKRAKNICEDILNTVFITKNVDIVSRSPIQMIQNKKFSHSNFYKLRKNFAGYDLVIIDPLLAFYGGDENDNSQARMFMQPFMDWASEENICIVFLHHSKKNKEDSMRSSARGAGAFVDAARTVYQIDKIYHNKHTGALDMDNAHMREFMLTKDNYGVIRLLNDYKVQREITPKKSARVVEVEYTDYIEPKIEMTLL